MPEKDAASKFIKNYRKENQKSQEEFSMESGVSVETLSLIERKKSNFKIETLQKIAAYTGKTVSEILEVRNE